MSCEGWFAEMKLIPMSKLMNLQMSFMQWKGIHEYKSGSNHKMNIKLISSSTVFSTEDNKVEIVG
jgi:hypothetical protein